jgi:hypothetical protein
MRTEVALELSEKRRKIGEKTSGFTVFGGYFVGCNRIYWINYPSCTGGKGKRKNHHGMVLGSCL